MLKHALLVLAVAAVASCGERTHTHKYDPFAALDRHISHSLAYHYLWPWNQLIQAAAALDAEDYLEEPKIVSDSEKYQVNLNVKRFKPEELKIRVKNRNILIEGQHKELNRDDLPFVANHFVQRFIMPAGSKQEEVTAVLKENGILTVTVPKHDVPPPPPEREVPIEVLVPEKKEEDKTDKPELEQEYVKTESSLDSSTEKEMKRVKKEEEEKKIKTEEGGSKKEDHTFKYSDPTTGNNPPLEQLDLVESTTNHGKIRKKELKDTKSVMDNEVVKTLGGSGGDNGLDDALTEE